MIKINLLGDKTGIDYSARYIVLGYASSLVLCVIVFIALYFMTSSRVAALTVETDALQLQLDELKEKTKSVRELKQKKDTLQNKLAVIAKLKKSKLGPVQVMDDMNLALPIEVWLREVKEQSGEFRIKGRALDNQKIAYFMRQLGESDYFDAIELLESKQMYYSRRTGKVTPLPSMQQLRTPAFMPESRVTKDKESKWSIRDVPGVSKKSKSKSSKEGDEQFVKIKEFVLSIKVSYAGLFGG